MLLTSRRLLPLLVTQTLGAVNDNLFKNALVVLILFHAGQSGGQSAGPTLVALAGGLFILPYVLLSATAGQIADRFEKARTIRWVKLAEVALMAAAALGFWLASTPLLFAVLFGLGVQATFFGPLKYAILPVHLAEAELVSGNGLIEAGTFLGILAGTIAGSALFGIDHGPAIVSALGLLFAAGGVVSALFIPALARCRRKGCAVGCLYLDVDNFKDVNDTLGHAGGDAVLVEFSERLKSCVRQTDVVARLAGDEFVIVLEGIAQPAEAQRVAEKIVRAMEPDFQIGDVARRVTASIGVASADLDVDDADTLLHKADSALYRAKRAGRNQAASDLE